jgi:hypothetical protein
MLVAVYEVRNNRGVGHVGGDVDANHMVATCVLHVCQWVMAELVRLFHNVSVQEATQAIDSLVERVAPEVWAVNGKLRILDTAFSAKEKTFLLLYHSMRPVAEADLFEWVEHSNASAFRRDVLRKAHKEKLIAYDPKTRLVTLSPKGISHVEDTLLR